MTLIAMARHPESGAVRMMAGATGQVRCLGRFMHTSLPVERRSGLGPQLVVADFTIVLLACHVFGMIEGDLPGLRLKRQFAGSVFLLRERCEGAGDEARDNNSSC